MDETERASRFFGVNWILHSRPPFCSFNEFVYTFFPLCFHLFIFFLSFFLYMTAVRPAPPLLCDKRKRRKKKRTRKKLILPLYRHTSNRSYNYNMTTRFRYMKEKKKRTKKNGKRRRKKREKIKWHTRCCFLSPLFFFFFFRFLSHTRNWTRRSPGSRFFF